MTPENRKGPDDTEIDALTKKGKGKSKGKHKTDGQKTSCSVCGLVGHMTKDCWFKDSSKGNTPDNKGKKGKGKRQGQRKEQCGRSHNSDRVDGNSFRSKLQQSDLANHPG